MLIGLLAASALGMAVMSSSKKSGADALRATLVGDQPQLQLPFPTDAQEPLEEGIPNLFLIFRQKMEIFAIFLSDGYLDSAYDNERDAIWHAGQMTDDQDALEINVSKVEVPFDLGYAMTHLEDLASTDEFRGYNGQNKIAKQGGELSTVWSWTIYDEPFEDWPEDLQKDHRERIVGQLETAVLPKGSLVYHSTDLTVHVEDEELSDLGYLAVVLDERTARALLTDAHHKPRPEDQRLLTYRTSKDLTYHVVPDNEVEYTEEILGIDVSDDEQTDKKLSWLFSDEGIDITHLLARGRLLLRDLDEDDLQLISVVPLSGHGAPQ